MAWIKGGWLIAPLEAACSNGGFVRIAVDPVDKLHGGCWHTAQVELVAQIEQFPRVAKAEVDPLMPFLACVTGSYIHLRNRIE